MAPQRVVKQLQFLAAALGLPEPIVAEDHDGQHIFVYSHDQSRRYAYSLTWAARQGHLLWVMLNPGTGESEGRRRSTFERCKEWSKSMGYGGLLFGNVFSQRSKSARDLLTLRPGPDTLNDHALSLLSNIAPETIVAWGSHGAKSEQAKQLRASLRNPKCFGYTKNGQPRHPLYVRKGTPLVTWPRSEA
jgi:hypothetical protein